MIITGSQYRYFYPQNSLNFNFKVSNYSSNNFEIGLTGTDYVHFKFKDGVVKDHYNNIIGTFNKDFIDIVGYIQNNKYEYYLNSLPIARDLSVVNGNSGFNCLVVKILDAPETNSLEITASINGEKVPNGLEFSNFYSTEATSGKLANNNEYAVDIFSLSSNSITGDWVYPNIINPNTSINFYNYNVTGLDENSPITLNLETNFGESSYTLYVQKLGSSQDALVYEDYPVDITPNYSTLISNYSGIIETTGTSKSLYKIDYILSDAQQFLDLKFDYIQGKTGNVIVNLIKELDVTFSGFLQAEEGKCSGVLSNDDFSWIEYDYTLGSRTADITLSAGKTLTGFFQELETTGIVSIEVDGILKKSLNEKDFIEENFYYMDLGGKTGLYAGTKDDVVKEYTRPDSYKNLRINKTSSFATLTAEVGVGQEGKYTFEEVDVPVPSSILYHSQNYINPFTLDQTPFKTLYPYRGIAYGALENQFTILSGDKNGSQTPFLVLNQSSDAIFFKNLPNIDYNGQYTINSSKIDENLIKGRVLADNESLIYYKTGLYFTRAANGNAINFINNGIIEDGINAYYNLQPFDSILNTKSQLFITENQTSRKVLGPEIDWNDNNFLAVRKENISKTAVFYSDLEKLTFGFVVKHLLFLKNIGIISETLNLIDTKIYDGSPIYIRPIQQQGVRYDKYGRAYYYDIPIPSVDPNVFGSVSVASTGSGTVSVSAGGTTWTGVGTKFKTQFKIGDYIISEGQTLQVASVISDTSLTTSAAGAQIVSKPYQFPGTIGIGTVSVSVGGTNWTGIGTKFKTQFRVGEYISSEGQTLQITSIDSETSLTTSAVGDAISGKPYKFPYTWKGNNTEFINQLKVGYYIIIDNKSFLITSIISKTELITEPVYISVYQEKYEYTKNKFISGFIESELPTEYLLNGVNLKFKKYITENNNTDKNYSLKYSFTLAEQKSNYLLSFYILPSLLQANQNRYVLRVYINDSFYSFISITKQDCLECFFSGGPIVGSAAYVIEDDNNINEIIRIIMPIENIENGKYDIKFSLFYEGENLNNILNDIDSIGAEQNFNPNNLECYFQIAGLQIEKKDCENIYDQFSCPASPYSDFKERSVPAWERGQTSEERTEINREFQERISQKIQADNIFSFFIHSLYGLDGNFYGINNFFAVNDFDLREARRKSCGGEYDCFVMARNEFKSSIEAWRTYYESIVEYKGQRLGGTITPASSVYIGHGIFKFFMSEIWPLISENNLGKILDNNFPIVFTDFDKLYLKHANGEKQFEKNDPIYGEGIVEIIDLLLKYNSFTYEKKTFNNKNYYLPISYQGNYKPIEDSNLSDVVFSGYLSNKLDLNIQAGYCRYYPYDSSTNASKSQLFGYFYETENFFDVLNPDLVYSQQNEGTTFINSAIFPNQKEKINFRPKKDFNGNITTNQLVRLIKNNSVLSFSKYLNTTVYVSRCFFKETRQVQVNLSGVFYNLEKRISDVWSVKLFNTENSTVDPEYQNPNTDVVTYFYKTDNIGKIKDGTEQSLYLEVVYNHDPYLQFEEPDKALIILSNRVQEQDPDPQVVNLTIF